MPQEQIRHTRVSLESSICGGNEHKRQSDQQPPVNGYLFPNAVNGGYLSLRAGSSKGQESVLRDNGFEIISAATPLQARFEIEMGRCGILLTSYITPFAICRDCESLRSQLSTRPGHLPDGASRRLRSGHTPLPLWRNQQRLSSRRFAPSEK